MPTARLDIAYDGSRFAGWAAQRGLRTVQGEIEDAIERITGERVQLTVAGRTDAGVHARGQVASFEIDSDPPDRFAERLNAVLARDVAVRAAGLVPDGFDARRDAVSRAYEYRVLASPIRDPFEEGRALWWRHPVEVEALEACAAAVVGNHDFTAFTPTQTEHVLLQRTVDECRWETRAVYPPPAAGAISSDTENPRTPRNLTFRIEAPAFMRNQVRVLVGTMLEVAGRRRSLDDFVSLLSGAPRERAGETAPAHGLYLVEVRYRS